MASVLNVIRQEPYGLRRLPQFKSCNGSIFAGKTPVLADGGSAYAKHLLKMGVTHVLKCNTDDEAESCSGTDLVRLYVDNGLKLLNHPIEDFHFPKVQDLRIWLKEVLEVLADPRHTVLVHCTGGKGRTGLVLACLSKAVDPSLDGAAAVQLVRQWIPDAVETSDQCKFVQEFHM